MQRDMYESTDVRWERKRRTHWVFGQHLIMAGHVEALDGRHVMSYEALVSP